MFHNREDAGLQLADMLRNASLLHPVVLGIPRGGVVVAATLARELSADLDVILARKLRAPYQPELALGAISEDGKVYLNRLGEELDRESSDYLEEERRHQLAEIERRKKVYRQVRPREPLAGRSVIVTDDGIATGSTMLAALHTIKADKPHEVIVAVPVGSPERLEELSHACDRIICLRAPETFWAIGQFYEDFSQVDDATVVELLRRFAPASRAGAPR